MMDWDMDMEDVAAEDIPRESDVNNDPDPIQEAPASPVTIAAGKINIQGLDTFSTDDVKALTEEHFGQVKRVEWIDDESANLVFSSETEAQEALLALSAIQIGDTAALPLGESVLAKALSSKPDVTLQIRFALLSDKKVPGAAARSRYYLFHPEQDPEERRKQREQRYRKRDRDEYRGSRRTRARGQDDVMEIFHAAMYDDDEAALMDRAKRVRDKPRSRSRDSVDRYNERRRNQRKELFPDRSRNRSASPLRDKDRDSRIGVAAGDAGTSNNRRAAFGLKEYLGSEDGPKELFPAKTKPQGGGHMDRLDGAEEATRLMEGGFTVDGDTSGNRRDALHIKGAANLKGRQSGFAIKGAASAKVTELFPNRFGFNSGKELFGGRGDATSRPRKKAEDLFG